MQDQSSQARIIIRPDTNHQSWCEAKSIFPHCWTQLKNRVFFGPVQVRSYTPHVNKIALEYHSSICGNKDIPSQIFQASMIITKCSACHFIPRIPTIILPSFTYMDKKAINGNRYVICKVFGPLSGIVFRGIFCCFRHDRQVTDINECKWRH